MALPLVDKQNRGQVLYRQGKYREALEIFSSILEKWHDPPISVLDNRAATYMKLKEFPKALKDARSMINREKAMASGYLRAGQVLQRMDENDKAQGIYEYGLKNVSVGDSKLLRGVLEDLRAKCAPAKAMDVLMELPVELIEMILSYLSFRNIVALLRVSKKWRSLIEDMPRLFRHLDLSVARKPISLSCIQLNVRRAKGQTSHITFNRTSSTLDPSKTFGYVLRACKKLEFLHIKDSIFNQCLLGLLPSAQTLNTLVITSDITYDCTSQLLENCPTLAHVEFHSITLKSITGRPLYMTFEGDRVLSSLRVLLLKRSYTHHDNLAVSSMDRLLNRAPNLAELTVRNLNHVGSNDFRMLLKLRKLHFNCLDIGSTLLLPLSLRDLEIGLSRINGPGDEEPPEPHYFPHLTHLTLCLSSHGRWLPAPWLDWLSDSLGSLQSLRISDWEKSFNGPLVVGRFERLGPFESLTNLSLDSCSLDDDDLLEITTRCPNLVDLDLSNNDRITGVGLKELVNGLSKTIRSVYLVNCEAVSGDAVDWARNRGVRVRYTFPATTMPNTRR